MPQNAGPLATAPTDVVFVQLTQSPPDNWGRSSTYGTYTGATILPEKCVTAADYASNNWQFLNGVYRWDTQTYVGSAGAALTNSTGTDFQLPPLQGIYAFRWRLLAISTGTVNVQIYTSAYTQNQAVLAVAPVSIAGSTVFSNGLTLSGGLFVESQTGGITAHSGGGQGSAVAITTEVNQVGTVAAIGDSVKLPASQAGLTIAVANTSATSCNVFPASGDAINGQSANTAVAQMGGSVCFYVCYASGQWVCEGTGGGYVSSFQTVNWTNNITAHSGGGQGSATLLTTQYNRVVTVAAGNDSVLLPVSTPGLSIVVANAHASNSLNVFPQSGDAINALGANAAFAVTAGKVATFFCMNSGQWHSQLTA